MRSSQHILLSLSAGFNFKRLPPSKKTYQVMAKQVPRTEQVLSKRVSHFSPPATPALTPWRRTRRTLASCTVASMLPHSPCSHGVAFWAASLI